MQSRSRGEGVLLSLTFDLRRCEADDVEDIDSEQPMMQLGQNVFAGQYEDALGTCVLFEEGPGTGTSGSGPALKYKCHTVKKLMMQRVFLSDKKENGADSAAGGEGDKQGDTVCQSDLETKEDSAKG
ncbi:general transcription factor 3C polypeptide 6 isoform X4 [Entelurus aequoreus]|uniref:general transcription factor 3C polypeptide 6 isoform X4 n=1 Tax=Entelurus aequoreus TaxID=161455 RepID=UPI002B1D208C|nr:general transcription factor 3C polypeptide 6 isoform X4 [Entelurus aequoreus]